MCLASLNFPETSPRPVPGLLEPDMSLSIALGVSRSPILPTLFWGATRPLAACLLLELRRVIAARKDRKVRVAPSRSPRASARRRGALEFTPHFAGLSHHQKSASRDQEVAPPARHAASEPPNTATHFCSPVRAPKTRSRAAPSTAAASRPGDARSFGGVRQGGEARPRRAEPVRVETRFTFTLGPTATRAAAPTPHAKRTY